MAEDQESESLFSKELAPYAPHPPYPYSTVDRASHWPCPLVRRAGRITCVAPRPYLLLTASLSILYSVAVLLAAICYYWVRAFSRSLCLLLPCSIPPRACLMCLISMRGVSALPLSCSLSLFGSPSLALPSSASSLARRAGPPLQ